MEKVAGTPFDFSKPLTIGARINDKNEQLSYGKGYDHNFVLNKTKGMGMFHAATVQGDKSGIVLDIYTTEPGLQFYSGNVMQGENTFKGGSSDDFRTAIALETQHFPDSPNRPFFPSTVLRRGRPINRVLFTSSRACRITMRSGYSYNAQSSMTCFPTLSLYIYIGPLSRTQKSSVG
ncbi:aldose epimerase family protein [Pedobacter sp. NJ-S-72]